MRIDVERQQPIPLIDGREHYLTYACEDASCLPSEPGIYAFGRSFGKRFHTLYIGQAASLSRRIPQQLNHAKLMNALKQAAIGRRQLLIGVLRLRPGQQLDKCLNVVERALIEHALAEGHELFNKHGTRTKVHEIASTGARLARCVAPAMLKARA